MAKPTNTTGDRDYGKRLYVSRKQYQEQMRRRTDALYDRKRRVPHSESKKPYLPTDYPEMEYFHFDWDGPVFPDYPPIEPDTPTENPLDPVTGGGAGKEEPGHPFLGCDFIIPITPRILSIGEIGTARLKVIDDSIVAIWIQTAGVKVKILSSTAFLRTYCSAKGREALWGVGKASGNFSECAILVQPIAFEGYQPGDDLPWFQIHVEMASGLECDTIAFVQPCPPLVELEYDWENSAETVAQGDEAQVYVIGGAPPYKWSISGGSGFSIVSDAKTSHPYATIALAVDGCGSATITCEDVCGTVVEGGIRAPVGQWGYYGGNSAAAETCVLAGMVGGLDHCVSSQCFFETIRGQYKQAQVTNWAQNLMFGCTDEDNPGGDCNWTLPPSFPYSCYENCNLGAYCSPTYGCGFCLTLDEYDMPDHFRVDDHCFLSNEVCEFGGHLQRRCVCLQSYTAFEWICPP